MMHKEFTYPSAEELLKWKFQQSDEHTKKALMEQASEDALLADALDGLAEMRNPHHLNTIQAELQAKLAAKLPVQSPTIIKPFWQQVPFQYVSSAAAAVLIVWLSFFFYQKTKDTKDHIAQNYTNIATDSSISSTEKPEEVMYDSITTGVNQQKETESIVNEVNPAIISEQNTNKTTTTITSPSKGGTVTGNLPFPSVTQPNKPTSIFSPFPIEKESPSIADGMGGNVNVNVKTEEKKADFSDVKGENIAETKPSVAATSSAKPEAMMAKTEDELSISATPSAPIPLPSNPVKAISTQTKGGVPQTLEKASKASPKKAGNKSKAPSQPKASADKPQNESDDAKTEEAFWAKERQKDQADNQPSVFFLQGVKLYESNQYDAAIQQFAQVNPNEDTRQAANYFTGMCYMELGKYKEAIPFLQKAASDKNHAYYKKAKEKLAEAKKKK
ncbi:MAG: tetratricopeptide repeat protein [Bacteroidia bacterium]